jgi:dTDP-4-dehydrorhamnose 3,5-epimerase
MTKRYKLIDSKKIISIKGNIYRLLRTDDKNYIGFGEAYVSKIKYKKNKGWKKHKKMTLNLSVPSGKVRFVIYDNERKKFHEAVIGDRNYKRLIIFPNTWFAFQGLSKKENIIINVSNILHSDNESLSKPIKFFNYNWST